MIQEKNFEVWLFSALSDATANHSSPKNFERGPSKENSCEVWFKIGPVARRVIRIDQLLSGNLIGFFKKGEKLCVK